MSESLSKYLKAPFKQGRLSCSLATGSPRTAQRLPERTSFTRPFVSHHSDLHPWTLHRHFLPTNKSPLCNFLSVYTNA